MSPEFELCARPVRAEIHPAIARPLNNTFIFGIYYTLQKKELP
jgi:hypothetical protein